MNIYNDGIASSQFQNHLLFCDTFKYLFLVPKGFARIIGYPTKIFIFSQKRKEHNGINENEIERE